MPLWVLGRECDRGGPIRSFVKVPKSYDYSYTESFDGRCAGVRVANIQE